MVKLDFRLTALTLIAWVILLPIFSMVHEVGHGLICSYYGNEPTYYITLIQNAVTCSGNFSENPGSVHSFRMAGGFLSASLALILFVAIKDHITPKTRFIAITLVVIGVTQGFNMGMETFAHDFYINQSSVMTMINTLGAMMMLFFLIQRHSQQKPQNREIAKALSKINESNEKKDLRQRIEKITGRKFSKPTKDNVRERLIRSGKGGEKEIPQNIFQRSIVDIIKNRKPEKPKQTTVNEVTFASLDSLREEDDEI